MTMSFKEYLKETLNEASREMSDENILKFYVGKVNVMLKKYDGQSVESKDAGVHNASAPSLDVQVIHPEKDFNQETLDKIGMSTTAEFENLNNKFKKIFVNKVIKGRKIDDVEIDWEWLDRNNKVRFDISLIGEKTDA
jgi:hypothetical protein